MGEGIVAGQVVQKGDWKRADVLGLGVTSKLMPMALQMDGWRRLGLSICCQAIQKSLLKSGMFVSAQLRYDLMWNSHFQ